MATDSAVPATWLAKRDGMMTDVYYARHPSGKQYFTIHKEAYDAISASCVKGVMQPVFNRDAWVFYDNGETVELSGLTVATGTRDKSRRWIEFVPEALAEAPPDTTQPVFDKTLDELFAEDEDE